MYSSTFFFILWGAHIILESLPISSSGHITLLNNVLARFFKQKPFALSSTVNHLMHIPTLFVISAFLLHHDIIGIVSASHNTLFHWLCIIGIANAITVIFYALLKKYNKKTWSAYVGFFITGLALLSLYFAPIAFKHYVSYTDAALIGLAQSIALLWCLAHSHHRVVSLIKQ